MKLKLIALAGLMATTVTSFAAMSGAASGNGELLLNMRYYSGASNAGGDDISAVFDLGVTMNDFLAGQNTAGFGRTWNLKDANYGTAFNDFLAAVDGFTGSNRANIEYNVIALDSTGANDAGGSRYLSTAAANAFPALSNSGLRAFDGMDVYVQRNNLRGTHATFENGASIAVQSDGSDVNPVYFGSIVGTAGDTWRARTTDTTARVGVLQNFYFLTTSSTSNTAQSTRTAFGFDMNGDKTLQAAEFGKFYFGNLNTPGTPLDGGFGFANPVPEPETYAMLIAGLGLVGAIARRRRANKA